ncbi:hypothetical protein JAAARDRAFT_159996 [Jaapia argillacea MUCL 33604]|uniref:Uncharacterized protein n=1 Tax=Jaapia argillacea MUCL 33604 TaxID=933084 RepID=A0A067PLU3_9AGAM|nr:hypothetical protein JAAARDRAFT_159996 [Jaapia argillacea MUCL 33604]
MNACPTLHWVTCPNTSRLRHWKCSEGLNEGDSIGWRVSSLLRVSLPFLSLHSYVRLQRASHLTMFIQSLFKPGGDGGQTSDRVILDHIDARESQADELATNNPTAREVATITSSWKFLSHYLRLCSPSRALFRIMRSSKVLEAFASRPSRAAAVQYEIAHHDGVVHDPLGGGSYAFETSPAFLDTVLRDVPIRTPKELIINIGAQPNNSPHVGTLVTFALAFGLARAIIKSRPELDIRVLLDIVDTAPSVQEVHNGITYQRSQRSTNEMAAYMDDYMFVLDQFKRWSGIPYTIRRQDSFNTRPQMPIIIDDIVRQHEVLAPMLVPRTRVLALRRACPVEGCGLADKHGKRNSYEGNVITFQCPHHGPHTVTIDVNDPRSCVTLEYNTPLRNLIRARACLADPDAHYIRVTGSDYAGLYQEQLLHRHLDEPYVVVYSPLITDWSGAKLSKSLYVKDGAYGYLEELGMDYLLSFAKMKEQGKELRVIYDEVQRWVDEPFRLFRPYSIYYMHTLFQTSDCRAGL